MFIRRTHLLLPFLAAITLASASAAEVSAPLFEKDIRPILKTHCFHCHGEEPEDVKAGLDVRLVGYFNGSLQLDVAGPRERIVQFVPRDAAGGALATNNSRIDETDEPGRWRASLSVSGRPQSLDIVFAETQEQIDYPFDLTIAAE